MRTENVSPFPLPINEAKMGSSNPSTQLFDRIVSASGGALLTSLVGTVLVRFFDHVEPCSCRTLYVFDRPLLQSHLEINGTFDGMLKITRNEGLTGLWRGLSPTLLMAIPATVIYYIGYETIRECLKQRLTVINTEKRNLVAPLLAGSMARIIAVTMISPLELLKTKVQYHGGTNGLSLMAKTLLESVRTNGPRVLYQGLVPTLWRDVPFSAVYWAGYEHFRTLYAKFLPLRDAMDRFSLSFFAGASAGMIAAAFTAPFDVAKTRQQVDNLALANINSPKTILRCLIEIWKREGIAGLTLGIIPRMCKVAPSCAIMTDGRPVQREAKLALTRAVTVFISYLTAQYWRTTQTHSYFSNNSALEGSSDSQKPTTITSNMINNALRRIGFGELEEEIHTRMQRIRSPCPLLILSEHLAYTRMRAKQKAANASAYDHGSEGLDDNDNDNDGDGDDNDDGDDTNNSSEMLPQMAVTEDLDSTTSMGTFPDDRADGEETSS